MIPTLGRDGDLIDFGDFKDFCTCLKAVLGEGGHEAKLIRIEEPVSELGVLVKVSKTAS
jgi:hypothetical protein